MEEMIHLKINNIDVEAPKGSTIIQAARHAGINIPSLCYLKDINVIGACRICVVEVKGARGLVASCVYPVSEGMEVYTNTPKVRRARKMTLELILSNHRMDCITCARSGNCELQELAQNFGVTKVRFQNERMEEEIEASTAALVRDNSKCILCRRCVAACHNVQTVGVIGMSDRGFPTHVGSPFDRNLNETACVSCGQCINSCPTGTIYEKDSTEAVYAALADPTKHVIVGTAPSVRAALGEEFGMPIGTNVEGKMISALRMIGFKKVFDVDTAADLTIMEEGTEFLKRLEGEGPLPLITSCSPGWVRFCEAYFPEFIPNLSSCKSPQQMFGAMMKTYYAKRQRIDPKDIVVVTVMPCTAKKYEVLRPEMCAAGEGIPDVDYTITTRELARMIKHDGLIFQQLPDGDFDPAFGESTGASVIFGTTGGVMEAALRTVAEKLTGQEIHPDFHAVRGYNIEGKPGNFALREAELDLAGKKVRVAVVSGLGGARKLLNAVKNGEAHYDFIEIMGCPGGCINGGGQPIQHSSVRAVVDVPALRAAALYQADYAMPLRKSHENPVIMTAYEDFLGEPGGVIAHHILHTTYTKREKYKLD